MDKDKMINRKIIIKKCLVCIKQFARKMLYGRQFNKDKIDYIKQNHRKTFDYVKKYEYPCYMDRYQEAGYLGAYFWQDLWAARHLYEDKPDVHYDIGSRIDGFIGHICCFIKKVILIDVRPLEKEIPNVTYICMDATKLEKFQDESIDSISSLCALEHFGLGRYGDAINPEGCFEAFSAIQRVLKPGARAYIAVPIGKEHLEFNAHRIFYAQTIVDCFSDMKLLEFSTVHNLEDYIEYHVDIHKYDQEEDNGGMRFGLFAFEKK